LIHQLRLIENDGISVSEALPKLEFSINNRLQSATKQTPNSLTFCYDIRGPGGTVMSKRLSKKQHRESKTNLILAQDVMKKNYDKTRKRSDSFVTNDLVYLKSTGVRPQKSINKRDPLYLGPFRVLRQTSDENYSLELPGKYKSCHNNFHSSKLKRYFERTIY
jgi:hypothetical protein